MRNGPRHDGAVRLGAFALSRYCLDTSAYSNFKRGDPLVVQLIDHAEWLGMPSIVLGELWCGFLLGSRLRQNQVALDRFLAHPFVQEILIDREIGEIYGDIAVSLRRAGKTVPVNDMWIAAAAAKTGAIVLTYDPHFRAIQRAASIVLPAPTRNQ